MILSFFLSLSLSKQAKHALSWVSIAWAYIFMAPPCQRSLLLLWLDLTDIQIVFVFWLNSAAMISMQMVRKMLKYKINKIELNWRGRCVQLKWMKRWEWNLERRLGSPLMRGKKLSAYLDNQLFTCTAHYSSVHAIRNTTFFFINDL